MTFRGSYLARILRLYVKGLRADLRLESSEFHRSVVVLEPEVSNQILAAQVTQGIL